MPTEVKKQKKLYSSEKGNKKSKERSFKFKVPNNPYTKQRPNKNKPDINDPDMKYFKLASAENAESLLKLAKV